MILGGAGPLDAIALKAVIAQAGIGGSHLGDFIEHLGCGTEAVAVAQGSHNVGEDLKVSMAVANGLDGLADALYAALGIGEGTVLLCEGGTGKNYVRKGSGLGEEYILNNQEFALLQRLFNVSLIGIRHHGILAHDIQAANLAFFNGVHYFGYGEAGLGGQLYAPCLFKLFANLILEYLLVCGIVGGQAAHIAGALNVVLTAQGVYAAAILADLAAEQSQVGDAHNALGTGGVLGKAHCVVDAGLICLGIETGGLLKVFGIDIADLCNHLGGVILDHFNKLCIAFGALVDVLLILQALADDNVHHAVEEGHVSTGFELEEYVRIAAEGDAAGFNYDYLAALLM